jgi:hypothetical protein
MFRGTMRPFPTLACIAGLCILIGLSGCKGKCQELSEKLCDCMVTTIDRDACRRQAGAREGRVSPTAAQEQVCVGLIKTCDCHNISTLEGKRACGLAR